MDILYTNEINFSDNFDLYLKNKNSEGQNVKVIVEDIINEVKTRKDEALKDYIKMFDSWEVKYDSDIKVSEYEIIQAYENCDERLLKALKLAKKNIEEYHKKQIPKSWIDTKENGIILGQKVSPVDRAGLYIPGGKASYPSSLLMNAVAAQVAGVEEIIVCTPAVNSKIDSSLLAASHLCGIKNIYKLGGASAIAAMAYGTDIIKKVDVITGPGNIFVATAKKLVYGDVNIDMIAGPSEIAIISDGNIPSKLVAIDMLSQAEHDEKASSILITNNKNFAKDVITDIYKYLPKLSRSDIARKSIDNKSLIIICENLKEAVDLSNQLAPEHLEILIEDPFSLLPMVKHAGAIFLGKNTPEAIGDYIAGPNHTLPTAGTAKFYSPLSVDVFLKKSSIISFSYEALKQNAEDCVILSNTEGLDAHSISILERIDKD